MDYWATIYCANVLTNYPASTLVRYFNLDTSPMLLSFPPQISLVRGPCARNVVMLNKSFFIMWLWAHLPAVVSLPCPSVSPKSLIKPPACQHSNHIMQSGTSQQPKWKFHPRGSGTDGGPCRRLSHSVHTVSGKKQLLKLWSKKFFPDTDTDRLVCPKLSVFTDIHVKLHYFGQDFDSHNFTR